MAELSGEIFIPGRPVEARCPLQALLACYFISVLVRDRIKRELQSAMADRKLPEVVLYSEDRACGAPSLELLGISAIA